MAHPEISARCNPYGANSSRMTPWGEARLDVIFDPPSGAFQSDNRGTVSIELTRSGVVAIEDAIRDGMRPKYGGKSIAESIMEDLVEIAVSLRDGTAHDVSYAKGRAAGLARAVATIRNPYNPDESAVRSEVKAALGLAQSAQQAWLNSRTVSELKDLAKWYGLPVELGMRKEELVGCLEGFDLSEEVEDGN